MVNSTRQKKEKSQKLLKKKRVVNGGRAEHRHHARACNDTAQRLCRPNVFKRQCGEFRVVRKRLEFVAIIIALALVVIYTVHIEEREKLSKQKLESREGCEWKFGDFSSPIGRDVVFFFERCDDCGEMFDQNTPPTHPVTIHLHHIRLILDRLKL